MMRRGMEQCGVRVSRLFALAGLVICFGAGPALSLDVEAAATCVFENATRADKDVLKKLIVAAMSDDLASVKGLTLLFASGVTRVAMDPCKVTVEQLGQPEMVEVIRLYSEKVGKQVMEEAFAKLK